MKKRLVIFFLGILLCFNFAFAEIRINEVELNPPGSDSGAEWIEFYSSEWVSLENYSLLNSNNQEYFLNGSFQGYYTLIFSSQWLNNVNFSFFLRKNAQILDFVPILNDNSNDDRTWQYCSFEWKFLNSSKNSENNCVFISNEHELNKSISYDEPISLDLDFHKDFINNEENEIEVKAENLEEDYDLKIWIEAEIKNSKKLISEVYDENFDKWISGTYYLDEFFLEDGEKKILIRLKKDYINFTGNAKIYARLRKSSSSSIAAEFIKSIKILGEKNSLQNNTNGSESPQLISYNEAIVISKKYKETIFESKTENIKRYSLYLLIISFIMLFILLLILSIYKKRKRKKAYKPKN